MSNDQHSKLKNVVLDLAFEHDVIVCCYATPHDIALSQSTETRMKYAANALLLQFNKYLSEKNLTGGVAVFDRTTDDNQHRHFEEVFQRGLSMPNDQRLRLPRISAYLQGANGTSHLSSVCDIVVGACRFAINEPRNPDVGRILLRKTIRMMWGKLNDREVKKIRERGFILRPKKIRNFDYEANVEALVRRLQSYLKDS